MTALYLDFGNSRFKWKLAAGRVAAREYEDFRLWLQQLAAREALESVVVASVLSEQRLQAMVREIKTLLPVPVRRCVVTAEAMGVRCAYRELDRLGIDRWLAVIAAWERHQGPCAVVDLGTAATLDFVDSVGGHQGGYIVSGLELALNGLLAGTDNVRPNTSRFESASLLPGVSTAEAIYHGALHGMVALIESSYQNLLKSFPQAKLILAGGDAALVGSHLHSSHEIVEGLVFEGMQLLEKAELLEEA